MGRSRRDPLPRRRIALLAVVITAVVVGLGGNRLWLALATPVIIAGVLLAERSRLHREREELLTAALTDPLTGLDNRRSLLNRAGYEIARHVRDGRSFALVMLDLDGFKALNDRFGHGAGDELLRDVAAALRRALRGQDTVARLGGDEFCVLAPETDTSGTRALAARVDWAVRHASVGIDGLTASIGVALFPDDGHTAARLMSMADQRLLIQKREGRRRPAHARRAA